MKGFTTKERIVDKFLRNIEHFDYKYLYST